MAKKMEKVDAVIVGAGWAGGIAAAELSKEGYKVVVLERGEDQGTEDWIGAKDELRYYRRGHMMQDLTKETYTSRNKPDETAYPLRTFQDAVLGRGTGGSGTHWNGYTWRWLPYDFEIYSKTVEKYGKDKIPEGMLLQDWGITYDELEPYYDKFEKMSGISGEEDPVGPKRSDDFPNPPMKKTKAIRVFEDATKKLGYHPFMAPSANMSQKYQNPDGETINACVYCSFCERYGCDFGAKASPNITVIATAEKTDNYELRNQSYVTRVLYEGDKATGLLYVDLKTGKEYEQPADLVVLSGYTFTNTRLLLLSEIGDPYNHNDKTGLIGKSFSGHHNDIHFVGATGFFEDKKFNNFAGAGSLGMAVNDPSGDNLDHNDLDFLHGYQIAIIEDGHGPLSLVGGTVPKDTPSWGEEFKEKSLFYTNRSLNIGVQPCGLSWDNNFMDLDPSYKDSFGDPLLRITTKFHDQDRKLMQHAVAKAGEIMKEMGADKVEVVDIPDDLEFNNKYGTSHYCGGVIMGESPETSAVNNYSQMWEMDNLFVLGTSSFPHISNFNPTGTIGAFAYRATEGMIEYLENDGGLLIEPKQKSES